MDPEIKKQFLSRFKSYFDAESPDQEAVAEVDLYRLFVELAALKTEVKTESRQVKTALDEFQGLIALLQRNNEQLSAVLVDITPYTFGTSAIGELNGEIYPFRFIPLIKKNSVIPVTKSEVFYTLYR